MDNSTRRVPLYTRGFFLLLIVFCAEFVIATDYKPVDLADMYQHDRWGTKPLDRLKLFRAYVSSFDGIDDDNGDGKPDTLGVPNWVAYELRQFRGEVPTFGRPSPWITEENWHQASTAPDDNSYKNSGYSRGHLAMKTHAARLGANADWNTHSVVNAVPQIQAHNTGPWLKLENLTAEWADGYGVVWIITGPVFENVDDDWIGDAGEVPIAVPDALFKIVVKESGSPDKPDVLAFLFPHTDKPDDEWPSLEAYLVSVDDIEEQTGLDFLTVLTDPVESFVEATRPTALWPSQGPVNTIPAQVSPLNSSSSRLQTPGPVNINTASFEILDTLPGIGPAMAQRIIDERPYASVDELTRVRGIGNLSVEKLRPFVTVE